MSVGRNEPCPCGSGKKYKKCCGKSEGLAIHGVLLEELEGLQRQLIDYAMENYSHPMKNQFQSLLHNHEALRKDPQVFLVAFEIWFILTQKVKKDRTILEQFVLERIRSIHRGRTQKIVANWPKVKFVAGEVEASEGTVYHVRDCLSGEKVAVRARQEVAMDKSFIVGGLLPFENEYTFFMIDFHFDKEMASSAKEWMVSQFKEAETDNPQLFLAENLLGLLNGLFAMYDQKQEQATEQPLDFEELKWEKDSQKSTAEVLESFLQEEGVEDLRTQTAILLWNLYCQKENPTIRKPEIYVGALFSLLQSYEIVEASYSNAALAKRLGVSAPSLSKRAKEMEGELRERLEQGGKAAQTVES
ncbi:hypothetical protein JOC78_001742 [Bacillus ectoiniformans]|uniref:SEC-C metal-binding domain-containing protein n=1 Tax=Bacillus ectoiniformans TaxID=1494429 RepID=UPI001958A593|nr:SEC-C metal-binding domain-containing protein [Bacillus ectoiniformans]MBM7648796.1 hypothetical protein [Bacillus ectoiniformans]